MRWRPSLAFVFLAALPAAAEKAVPRNASDAAPSEAEQRHPPASAATAAPTAAPTSPPSPRDDWAPAPTAVPTPVPTPVPTRVPEPTPDPDRSDVERRHPRPFDPPAPEPRRGDHRGRARPGHSGPHYHGPRYLPTSCDEGGVIDDSVAAPEPPDVRRDAPSDDGLARIRVLVDPPEARVFVDGSSAGLASDFDGMFERLRVVGGCREITLVLAGYRTHRVRLYAVPGETVKIVYDMRRGTDEDALDDRAAGLCERARREPPAEARSPDRRDFDIVQQSWFLAHGRLVARLGLVQLDLGPPAGSSSAAGPRLLSVRVEARAEGQPAAVPPVVVERESRVEPARDGRVTTSYRIDLAPGRYAMRLAVREIATGKASVVTESLEVPDVFAAPLNVPSLLVLEDVRTTPIDPRHPLAALRLEDSLPVPRFGNVFAPTEAPMLLFQYTHDAGAGAVYASGLVLGPDGAQVAAESRLQTEHVRVSPDRAVGAVAFGPIRLAGLRPGRYRVLVTVTDTTSLAVQAREAWFEVGADAAPKRVAGEAPARAGGTK
jgi:hypothetical protein